MNEKPLKVIQIMPKFDLAGAERMCETLTMELAGRGISVIVVSLFDAHSAITDNLEKHGIPVIYLHKKPGLDLSIIGKLAQLFRAEKPNLIHTHLYTMQYAIPAAILTGVKGRVHTVHNVAQKEVKKSAQKLNRLFYKFHNVVPVALSNEIQETIRDVYGIPTERIPVILNGISLEKCIPKSSYTIKDKIKFLHIGRFSAQKNHTMLIEAFDLFQKTFPDVELHLYGTGELEDAVKKQVKQLSLDHKVFFGGLADNVYPILNGADTFLLPSIYEGVPITLIEAMGTGLPVIATAVGGVPSMIEDGREGILVETTKETIAAAMGKMLDENLRKNCGENAIKKANDFFSAEKMGDSYLEVYKKQLMR